MTGYSTQKCPSMNLILEVVADDFGVTKLDLVSERRDAKTALARNVAMYCARHLTILSTVQIGRLIGDRHHTTVIHGVTRITAKMSMDGDFNTRVLIVMDALMRPAPFDVVAA